ncbi:MAG: ThiF family adenylyltransferase [Planctomycetes bacterium]|nr:ThiF family adenylyltransferase [Planctomycetota bacterium]
MSHLVQVGAGSGGMTVLDIVCRDPRLTHVTLIEPDVYKPHNVVRHQFPLSAVGQRKADLAAQWLKERRPELRVDLLACDLMDPGQADVIDTAVRACDIGICAADNEPVKFHFDAMMRRHAKPWTLGEVLSGGIGGFVHWFAPTGPCYGCVATFLRRSVTTDKSKPPDYSAPGGPAPETTIPASRASIEIIASLHAQITLQLLTHGAAYAPGFTSLLLTLEKVPGIFDEAFRTHRFRIPRGPECLICRDAPLPADLDRALDDALTRLS